MASKPAWKTHPRSGRQHLVLDRKPVCEAPMPPGGVTWGARSRGPRCPDCVAIERGATTEQRAEFREDRRDHVRARFDAIND